MQTYVFSKIFIENNVLKHKNYAIWFKKDA